MDALVLYGPNDIRFEDVEEPQPHGEWVRIKVKRVGICGTDKAFYAGTYKPKKLPIIPGHEISGIVDEVGDEKYSDLIGELVTTEINVHCRKCWYCRNGMYTHCPYRETIGISIDGGMAEYVLTRVDLLHRIQGLTWIQGTFVEPLAAVVEMTIMQSIKEGSNIAVIGLGTIGLLAIQLAKLYNPKLLIAIARPDTPKKSIAYDLGIDEVLTYEEAPEYMRKATPEGEGFDYVVEASGSSDGLETALNLVRPRGVIAAKSTHGEFVRFNYTLMVVKEVRIIGSRCGPFDEAIKLLKNGDIRVEPLLTSTYPLSRGEEAFERSFDRREIKIHLTP